jgi:hypothetical protein
MQVMDRTWLSVPIDLVPAYPFLCSLFIFVSGKHGELCFGVERKPLWIGRKKEHKQSEES